MFDSNWGNLWGLYFQTIIGMMQGKPPFMTVKVKVNKTGKSITKNVPMELHHQHLPQRMGSNVGQQAWNLTESTPWGHASMDPHRHTGYDLEKIIKGTNSW